MPDPNPMVVRCALSAGSASTVTLRIRLDWEGRGDTYPVFPGKRYEAWPVDDPAGHDVSTVRQIVDDIDHRVRLLLATVAAPAQRTQPAARPRSPGRVSPGRQLRDK
jgi:hypothetical protein